MPSKPNTTATKEEAKPALVPKLRFPEFRGAVAWHEGRIADIAVSESSSRALNKLSLKSEGYPVYGADSCVGFIDSFDQADDYIAIVKDGSGVGRLALKRGKSSVLGTLAYIKCKPGSETKLTWLYYCLNSLDLRQFIKGSGIPHIYFSDYATHEVLIPPLPEQQKIAECLSSVDDLITAQAQKVDALKAHKKGLMQRLFPREGETQPRLRFPEFQNAGEWEVKAIGDVFRVTRGEVLSMTLVKDEVSDEAPFPVYSSQTKNRGLAGYYSEHLYEDAITWTTDGANAGDVNFRPGKFYCTNVCGVLINTKGYANACVAALLNSVTRSHVSYVGNPKLMNGVMAKIEIPFPPLPEQQRIATCLSSLDALITAETQKLEALKTHKQSLMQQLFPAAEEVEA